MEQFMVFAFLVVAIAAAYYLVYLPRKDSKGIGAKDASSKADKK